MTHFRYHPDILRAYPQLTGGVLLARGVRNGPAPEALRAAYAAEKRAVIARLGGVSPSEIPSLAAWRRVFRSFGVDPTQYRCAGEALLRRLIKTGDIPGINTLVDIGNLVSIRHQLPVAALDSQRVPGGITVHFADGSEAFTDLNTNAVEHPAVGEVVFTDAAGAVHARRWCWRQSEQSAAREATTDVIFAVEAQHAGGEPEVVAALADLAGLVAEYAGGVCETAVLGAGRAGV